MITRIFKKITHMKKTLLLLCFIVSITKAQIPTALATQLQNVLNNKVANAGDHGVSAHLILQNGQTWSGTAGVDALNNPMTDTTVFITASISKMNIATLLLLLQEAAIIDLDDTWHKYLPTLNVAFDTNITIRQLLNHTSGLADYLEVPANQHYVTQNFSNFFTPQYILENIVSGVPDFAAGTNFNYSNTNYCLAGLVAEAATPNTLAQELHARVWGPAGMNHTYLGAYEPIPMPRAGVWWNFGSGTTNYSNQSDTSMLSFGFGTDNVVTTPTDLTKLVDAIINGNLLSAQSKTEMMSWVPQSYVNQWVAGYGLGMHHFLNQGLDTLVGHDGKFCNQSDVFHSSMCGFTLATMTNSETFWEGIYQSMYDVLRNYYQCNTVPVANFVASDRAGCAGTTITFSDSSTNWRPTAWNWSFPGGTLTGGTTLTDSMPQVIYNTPGVYAVSYTASTLGGSDAITKNGYITVNSAVASYNTAFVESFETATVPGADWSVSNTAALDWAVTSIGAATGTKSVYIDNYSNTAGNKSSLTSTAFDVSGFTTPKLTFKMAYQQKVPTNAEKLQVLTSTDCGATWVVRFTKQGSALATVTPPSPVPLIPGSSQFNTYTVNINGVAGSPNVRFRFDFTADPSAPGNYIFLDDINIFDASVGIKTNEAEFGLNIYPNPANSQFNISTKEIADEISVSDVLGRVVYSIKPAEKKVSLILENEGLYFVTVKTGAQSTTRKLVVKK